MTNQFEGMADTVLTPSQNAFAVVPSDSAALPAVPKFLYIGGTGNVTLRAMDATADVVFANVPAGGYLYVRATHVRAAGTTATAIVACA